MNKRPILVVCPSMPPMEEYFDEIRSLWDTKHLTHAGPKHQKLQSKLEEYLDVEHVSLFANGHLSLELAFSALELSGEVITTPFTFGSTTQAILRCGLKPVFCDIKPDDYTIDPGKIEELITEKTSAIVPVHVYGNICEIKKIQTIADKYKLKVIYDAAHAFGETYQGENVARFGDMSMFSFHATKVFHTVEGGCLTFSDDSKVQLLNGLKQFGQILHTDAVPYIGTNAKMTEVHAAMGLCNLRHMKEYEEKRGKIVARYRERLSGIEGIRLCPIQKYVTTNYAYFPVVFEHEKTGIHRNDISNKLIKQNIFARKYFYPLTNNFEICEKLGIKAEVPVAEYISDRVLTLPCYSDLDVRQVDIICDIILESFERTGGE